MNSVSWFLYATDVLSSLNGIFNLLSISALVGFVGLSIAVPMSEGDILEWKDYRKWWTRSLAVAISCGVFVAFIPSKNTMYAIAASQVGENIVKSEAAQEIASDATKALQIWIKKQIEPETKK